MKTKKKPIPLLVEEDESKKAETRLKRAIQRRKMKIEGDRLGEIPDPLQGLDPERK